MPALQQAWFEYKRPYGICIIEFISSWSIDSESEKKKGEMISFLPFSKKKECAYEATELA